MLEDAVLCFVFCVLFREGSDVLTRDDEARRADGSWGSRLELSASRFNFILTPLKSLDLNSAASTCRWCQNFSLNTTLIDLYFKFTVG